MGVKTVVQYLKNMIMKEDKNGKFLFIIMVVIMFLSSCEYSKKLMDMNNNQKDEQMKHQSI